jgi:hypothetical protein
MLNGAASVGLGLSSGRRVSKQIPPPCGRGFARRLFVVAAPCGRRWDDSRCSGSGSPARGEPRPTVEAAAAGPFDGRGTAPPRSAENSARASRLGGSRLDCPARDDAEGATRQPPAETAVCHVGTCVRVPQNSALHNSLCDRWLRRFSPADSPPAGPKTGEVKTGASSSKNSNFTSNFGGRRQPRDRSRARITP